MLAPMWKRAIVLVLALVCAVRVYAQPGIIPQSRTTLIVLDGTWGPPRPGHAAAADLILARGDAHYRVQVEQVRVLMGDVSGQDVIAEASARRPAFRLRGPEELLKRLDQAKAGAHVEITGYHVPGSLDLEVAGVVVGDEPRS